MFAYTFISGRTLLLLSILLLFIGLPLACDVTSDDPENGNGPVLPPPGPRFMGAASGDLVTLDDFNVNELPKIPWQAVPHEGAALAFSDMPEYFRTGPGISMQEPLEPGRNRVYVYHVIGEGQGSGVITAVLENTGEEDMTVNFKAYAFPPPSGNYLSIGKEGLARFFETRYQDAQVPQPITIAPGERAVLDPEMDEEVTSYPVLVHGFYEFDIDQPGVLSVLMRPEDMDSRDAVDELELLPRRLPGQRTSGAGRGLFEQADFDIVNGEDFILDSADGVKRLIIADGNDDQWVMGWDSIAEDEYENRGNYGVMYHLAIERTSSDNRGMAVLMGNNYAVGPDDQTNFCMNQSGAVYVDAGADPRGVVRIPEDQTFYNTKGEYVLLQAYRPLDEGETDTINIIYSPPGASCLPTPIVFVPFERNL